MTNEIKLYSFFDSYNYIGWVCLDRNIFFTFITDPIAHITDH
jgi:hypothetical protein